MNLKINLFNRKIKKADFFIYVFFSIIILFGSIVYILNKLEKGLDLTDQIFLVGSSIIFIGMIINIISYFKTKDNQINESTEQTQIVNNTIDNSVNKSTPLEVNDITEEISEEEKRFKSYIEINKAKYSKEVIKSELNKSGVSDEKLDYYLNKYY